MISRIPSLLRAVAAVAFATLPVTAQSAIDSLLDEAVEKGQRRVEASSDLWEDHSTWETAWEARSEHYLVKSTHSYGLAKAVADGQEVMLGHFVGLLGEGIPRSEPMVIHVRPDIGAYNTVGDAVGDAHSSAYGSFFAESAPERPVEVAFVDNRQWLQMQITHSAFHQFVGIAHPGGSFPIWLEEGLASYFSLYWNQAWGVEQLQVARDEGPRLALSMLTLSTQAAHEHGVLIQLGMFFSWLIDHRPETRVERGADGQPSGGPMYVVLRDMLDGESSNEFMRVIGKIGDQAAVLRAFQDYEFPR